MVKARAYKVLRKKLRKMITEKWVFDYDISKENGYRTERTKNEWTGPTHSCKAIEICIGRYSRKVNDIGP